MCAIYSTAALTQAWQMITECEFIGNQVTWGLCTRHASIDLVFLDLCQYIHLDDFILTMFWFALHATYGKSFSEGPIGAPRPGGSEGPATFTVNRGIF